MVSVGSKALLSRRPRSSNLAENILMAGDDKKLGKHEKVMRRKAYKQSHGFDGDNSNKTVPGTLQVVDGRPKKSPKNPSEPQPSVIRKQVDPETAQYFSEIANLFESGGVELEERSVICGNALEEASGKEFELCTDYIISHTLQNLLEGCDVDHLCSFLWSCAKMFPLISMDRSGSHVAETALMSLAARVQDSEAYSIIRDTLTMICKVIVDNPVDMMCNCYGSHVLRSLLCLCGGIPWDSQEFHGRKPSTVLAERLNLQDNQHGVNGPSRRLQGFPDLLKFLVSEILKCTSEDIKILQVDQYSCLVIQTALKLLAEESEELARIIPILLGCRKENLREENFSEMIPVGEVIELMKETAYSHLMEVIVGVAPESMYDVLFSTLFRSSLFELASHHCANFVIQALVSHARNKEQMELIWDELGPKFRDLLEMKKSGVVASIVAATQRLHTFEDKCCEALVAAVCTSDESLKCIIPRLLFLESYFSSEDKSCWNWPSKAKMHVMGSLILQAIFRFQSGLIQPFITSLISMEVDQILQTAKDSSGARVIEAFLGSSASSKHKHRLIMKLRGYFGELAMHPSGSFTIEKCFAASSLSLRNAIASDLLAVQNELSKTKQGPYILRKLDIDRFANQPEQWKSIQASKQSTYQKFHAAFGSSEAKSSKTDSFVSNTPKNTANPKDLNKMRKEIDEHLASKKYSEKGYVGSEASVTCKLAAKGSNQIPFLSSDMKGMKRCGKDKRKKSSKRLRL